MKYRKQITVLVLIVAVLAATAAIIGITSNAGQGTYEYQSIRGQTVLIYGKGLYQHMSAEVAIQGIAQDYVTLFVGIPLLLILIVKVQKGGLVDRLLLSGVLGYFFVTYLFYLVMAMYNPLFLVYSALMGTSFFALSLNLLSIDLNVLTSAFKKETQVKIPGYFLIINSITIAFLWLGVVAPTPENIYPKALEHYTTLVVQGLDLGLLLPLAALSGLLLIQRKPAGYLLGPVYLVFLSLLMTALVAKIVAMGLMGYSIIPVIFIIPTINVFSIFCTVLILRNIR